MNWKFLFVLWTVLATADVRGQQAVPGSSAGPKVVTADVTPRKLLWDSKRRQIVAVVETNQNNDESRRFLPNRIVMLDPASGAIDGSILVGETPSSVAIDPDGVYLYAALAARSVVRRFRLADRAWDLDVPVMSTVPPSPEKGPIRAMAPLPGKPGALVVATAESLIVFDNAVPRKATASAANIVALHARSASQIAAHASSGASGQIVHFTVSNSGIAAGAVPPPFRADGELIFGGNVAVNSQGAVFDLARGTSVGRVPVGTGLGANVLMLDTTGRTLHVALAPATPQGSSERRIVRYAVDRLTEIADMRLDLGTGNGGLHAVGLAWNDGVAVVARQLFIVPSSLFRSASTSKPVSVAPATSDTPRASRARPPPLTPRNLGNGLIQLALPTEAIAFHAASRTLYAAASGDAGQYANSVVAVDAQTGDIRNVLGATGVSGFAFSNDGGSLYAGSKNTPEVFRINPRNLKQDSPLTPPDVAPAAPGPPFAWRARSIAPVPGRPNAMVVLWQSGGDSLVAAYESGTRRPMIIPPEPKPRLSTLFPGDTSNTVYAVGDSRFNRNVIQRLDVSDRGVIAGDVAPLDQSLSSVVAHTIEADWFVDGVRLYRRTGAALRPAMTLEPLNPGSGAASRSASSRIGSTAIAADGSRMFVVSSGEENSLAVVAYDLKTFRPDASITAPALSASGPVAPQDTSAILAGSNLAIRTRSELILLPISTFTPWPGPNAAVEELAPGFRKIELRVHDLAGDVMRGKLHAATSNRLGAWGNSILTIDPASGAVERAAYAGSNPARIALTADGRSAFTWLDGENRIAHINLTGDRERVFDSGATPPVKVTDLAVSSAGVLAVGYTDGTVALFDDGRRRGGKPESPTKIGSASRLAFNEAGTSLLSYGSDPLRYDVTPEGLVFVPPSQRSAQPPGGRRGFTATAQIAGDLAYMPSGEIANITRDEIVSALNLPPQYAAADLRQRGQRILLDMKQGRAYIAAGGTARVQVYVFDLNSRDLLGVRDLPYSGGPVLSLVFAGADELAFHTQDAVYVLHISTIPLAR